MLDERKLILDKKVYSIQTKLRVFAWEISAQPVQNFMARFNNAIFAAAPEVPLGTLSIAKQGSLHRIDLQHHYTMWHLAFGNVSTYVPYIRDSLWIDA